MPSGWTRWLLEQFEFPFEVIYPPRLDEGGLRERFDVLVFPDGAIPGPGGEDERSRRFRRRFQARPEELPEELRKNLGRVTAEKTVPRLREFLEQGGVVLTIGDSTALAYHLGLPVSNPLERRTPEGEVEPLGRESYYVPGSVLQVRVDPSQPLAHGMSERVDVYFNNSPVFRLDPEALREGVRPVAWFDRPDPLRSGWAWGESALEHAVAVLEAPVGTGRLVLYGPEVLFRGQPHGTFKLFFNGILLAGVEEEPLVRP